MSNVNSRGYLLLLKAITPIHVGSSEMGIVDKPIQRDHLGLPIIFASSLKGALRHQISWKNEEGIFGSEPEKSPSEPGNVIFLDARPLFVPVRSLIGTYAYITSPYLLRILKNYLDVIGRKIDLDLTNNKIEKRKVIILNKGNRSIEESGKVYLNEIEFEVKEEKNNDKLHKIIKKIGLGDEPVVLVSDEVIVDLVNSSIIRYWRNRLEKNRKVVAKGALWIEEYIPEGTIFVSGFVGVKYRLNENVNLQQLINEVKEELENNSVIAVGGLETIGKGLVKLILYP